MNTIIRVALLTLATTNINYTNTTTSGTNEIAIYNLMNNEGVIELLYKINEGYKIVYDYCES